MRLVVIAVGRLKQGPERELAERYCERFDDISRKLGFRGLQIHEIPESRARDAETRIADFVAARHGERVDRAACRRTAGDRGEARSGDGRGLAGTRCCREQSGRGPR